jgi:hypothetical protein
VDAVHEGQLEETQDQARSHPLRLKILALAARKNQSLEPEDLCRELPGHPTIATVEYHLLVLRQAELLPFD